MNHSNIDDPAIKFLYVEQLALETAVRALIASHPNPDVFRGLLDVFGEGPTVALLSLHWEDKYSAQFAATLATYRDTLR